VKDIPANIDGWMWKAIVHAMPRNPTPVRRAEELAGDRED
jgi:hypothetical protein